MRSYRTTLLACFILLTLTACNAEQTQETSNLSQEEAVINEEESSLTSEDIVTDDENSTSISFDHGAINVTDEENKTTFKVIQIIKGSQNLTLISQKNVQKKSMRYLKKEGI